MREQRFEDSKFLPLVTPNYPTKVEILFNRFGYIINYLIHIEGH